jgi:hypothetical protein
MNHDERPKTRRMFVGKMMFVTAMVDMEAGTELTTSYGDAHKLKHWNI